MRIIGLFIFYIERIFSKIWMYLKRPLFKSYGRNVVFFPGDIFSYGTIQLGDDVFIGRGAHFSSICEIIIGNKVMFGPNVTIIGGDHNTTQIGEFMYDVNEKLPENDLPVIIEDDVWVGTGAIILKGVRVGKGSIIAAGAIVTKNVEPYSITGGVPAKKLRARFLEEDLEKHLLLLESKK
jgi:acetyltransferase-like isoleucine patch superfamily enzyme